MFDVCFTFVLLPKLRTLQSHHQASDSQNSLVPSLLEQKSVNGNEKQRTESQLNQAFLFLSDMYITH